MGRKDKGSGDKKRDSEEAAAAPKQKKPKLAAKEEEEEEHDAVEEESEEVEDLSEGDEGEEEEGEESDGEPSTAQVWPEALHKRAEEKGAMVCLLGNLDGNEEDEDEESDDEAEPTVEKLEAMTRLFLPKKTEEYLEALGEALGEIGMTDPEQDEDDEDEDDGMDAEAKKAFMRMFAPRMLTTKHSYPMHSIINASLKDVDKAIKSKKWEEAFCRWAGTLLAVQDETHWFADTDVPEEAVAIYKKLKKQWQQIKTHSLEDLGNPSCEGGSSPDVKAALEHMLGRLAKGLEEASIEM